MTPDEVTAATTHIDWASYHTAYGTADDIPVLLATLVSKDSKEALAASHELWCGLCHQHAYISSTALPSYPILFRVLEGAEDALAVELLDILWGFAKCSAADFFGNPQQMQWVIDLRDLMKKDLEHIRIRAGSKNEDIREFASLIFAELQEAG